jgi:hypothetical protein
MVLFRWLTHAIATCTHRSENAPSSTNSTQGNSTAITGSNRGEAVRFLSKRILSWKPSITGNRKRNQCDYSPVKNQMVERYAENNPEQQTFDLSGCVQLTDQSLWAIVLSRSKSGKKYYPGTILRKNNGGTYDITFEDGNIDRRKKAKHIRLPTDKAERSKHLDSYKKGRKIEAKRSHHLDMLSISKCVKITDNGLLPFAGTKIEDVEMEGVEKLTLVAAATLLIGCKVKSMSKLPPELVTKVGTALGGCVHSTAGGKTRLFIGAQPTANEFTVPFEFEKKIEDAEVTSLLILALKKLENLKVGGLHLDQQYWRPQHQVKTVDLTLKQDGEDREWMTKKHYGILFGMPNLGKTVTKLNLSNSNLRNGVHELVQALPKWRALRILDLSENNLGAEGVKAIAGALRHTQHKVDI